MMENPRNIFRATRVQSIAKYIERIADHATNVAEMVVFMVRGKDIRHVGKLERRAQSARPPPVSPKPGAVAREQLARLEVQHRLIDQREQERLQIARDLHDGPLQELIAATYSFRETAALVEDETLSASFAKIGASLHKLIDDLRSAASSLRPPALTRFGLGMAIRMHAAEYSEKYPDIQMSLEVQPLEIPIPESIRLAVFRIYQEALTNIAKHAQASRVSVQISRENQTIVLKIADNGIGFAPPLELGELAVRGHLGLVGMRERVEAVGGSIKISSQPGQGTTLEAQIPLPDEPRTGTDR
jgi:signal transduction histidine kinase